MLRTFKFVCQLVSRAGQYEQTGFIEVDANLDQICIDPSVSGRKSQTVSLGQSGFGGAGCHACIKIFAKKYCLSKRKNS